ncbi:hypothetical protein BRC75_03150 [Halobacteriales archaeon QH_7_69_31]|nr:MAG: hypothetical protein BRC75_03150 [Halobacteriales archaeon QH_7_69_31]
MRPVSPRAVDTSLGEAAGPRDVSADPDWRPIFGHAEPYDEQVDGIQAAVETAREDGFLALEGACGTGKTMLALTAGIHLVRDPDSRFERVFVLTSVKQQLRQFEADLRTINANLPEEWRPVSAMTLVGKADVCPYNLAGAGDIDDDTVYERCEGLRERTRGLTEETTADALAAAARSQQVGLADSASASGDGGGATYLEAADEPTPYPRDTPEAAERDVEYCPFYAQFLADLPEDGHPSEAVPFDPTGMGIVEPEDLVSLAAGHGSCPHSVMGALLPELEVLVGNYYHAFDPTTVRAFTGDLVDEDTFVVCDEAHMLEPRVRELVGDSVSDRALSDAQSELSRVIQPLAGPDESLSLSRRFASTVSINRCSVPASQHLSRSSPAAAMLQQQLYHRECMSKAEDANRRASRHPLEDDIARRPSSLQHNSCFAQHAIGKKHPRSSNG